MSTTATDDGPMGRVTSSAKLDAMGRVSTTATDDGPMGRVTSSAKLDAMGEA